MLKLLGNLRKDPLLHFVIIGILVFYWADLKPGELDENTLHFDRASVTHLVEEFKHIYHRTPDQAELQAMIDNEALNIVLHKEGIKHGLDKGDEIIKRRIIQKMNFLVESQAEPSSPSLTELQAYLDANINDFSNPDRFSFRHLYFAKHQSHAQKSLALLNQGNETVHRSLPFIKGDKLKGVTLQQASIFLGVDNSTLRKAINSTLESNNIEPWLGPIKTQYGYHIVQITKLHRNVPPTLSTHRDKIYKAWKHDQSLAKAKRIKQSLLEQYTITIDAPSYKPKESEHVAIR